jgi:hypothetical protein
MPTLQTNAKLDSFRRRTFFLYEAKNILFAKKPGNFH